jgi:DNA-binding NarL/FixJ family response regulator
MSVRAATKVLVVEDHPSLSEAVSAHLLGAGFTVLPSVAGVEAIDWALAPDVVVCDLKLQPGLSWGDAVRHLVTRGCRVLAMSGVATPEQVLDAIEQGALGFVEKTSPSAEFVTAVTAIANGGHHIGARLAGYLLDDVKRRPLASGEIGQRETRLLRALAQGDLTEEIAADWNVPDREVREVTARVVEATRRRRRQRAYRLTAREMEVVRLVGHRALSRHDTARLMGISQERVSELLANARDKYVACNAEVSPAISPISAARLWANDLGITSS